MYRWKPCIAGVIQQPTKNYSLRVRVGMYCIVESGKNNFGNYTAFFQENIITTCLQNEVNITLDHIEKADLL